MPYEKIFWLIIFVLTTSTLISFIWVFAPFFPTRKGHLSLITKVVDLKPGQTFYELGCGDARVSLAVASRYPKAHILGLELSGLLFTYSWLKVFFSGIKNVRIKWKNIFWQDLSNADVVYVFGMKESLNEKLKEKFLAELKPGSRIVSYVFSMNEWPGKTEVFRKKINDKDETKVTVYTVPK